jgi:hypothetical protein
MNFDLGGKLTFGGNVLGEKVRKGTHSGEMCAGEMSAYHNELRVAYCVFFFLFEDCVRIIVLCGKSFFTFEIILFQKNLANISEYFANVLFPADGFDSLY